ncbi:MAG: hypothetical protein K2N05_06680 [Muribaculaceae bacterium]|nr:hypothetical protein [Muribaculaceae bacterium]
MDNESFWKTINDIISDGFSKEGIEKLEYYGELFCNGKLIFKRFSPQEQYGCTKGGTSHVIATILAGAETPSDCFAEGISNIKREFQSATYQATVIEKWAKTIGIWIEDVDNLLCNRFGVNIAEGGEAKVYDNGPTLIKSIGLDYFILPVHALDRISLHNTLFPETNLSVIGFGKNDNGEFKIIVSQPFIEGLPLTEKEIENFALNLGFTIRNKSNWTYTTPYIYLSDLHDENVIKSPNGTIFVIDCDIRLNTPDLRLGGTRMFSNEIEILDRTVLSLLML